MCSIIIISKKTFEKCLLKKIQLKKILSKMVKNYATNCRKKNILFRRKIIKLNLKLSELCKA